MRKDRLAMDGIQDLGLRIVQAARLAVAVHLYESVARHTSPDGEAGRVAREILGRRVETGGAGDIDEADDDGFGRGGRAPQQRPSRLGDLVTDDEWDGLMGHDDGDGGTAGGGPAEPDAPAGR
jgi:hypothetical protein